MTVDPKIIENIILQITECKALPIDRNLITWGELDSIDFEQLFNEIELRFNLEIPSDKFSMENCSTPENLALMVEKIITS